ncbi:carbohydrate-binding protein [Paenibacillus chitinolyticus]
MPLNNFTFLAGKTYRALQGHTAMPGWEPANVPALWAVVS